MFSSKYHQHQPKQQPQEVTALSAAQSQQLPSNSGIRVGAKAQRHHHDKKSRVRPDQTTTAAYDAYASYADAAPAPAPATFKIKKPNMTMPSCWYYSSDHIFVNQERVGKGIAPLYRCPKLDQLARQHAETMAKTNAIDSSTGVYHSILTATELQEKLGVPYGGFVGGNVQRGESIRILHDNIMKNVKGNERANILSPHFKYFGMGTARGTDGHLYLVQLFRS